MNMDEYNKRRNTVRLSFGEETQELMTALAETRAEMHRVCKELEADRDRWRNFAIHTVQGYAEDIGIRPSVDLHWKHHLYPAWVVALTNRWKRQYETEVCDG